MGWVLCRAERESNSKFNCDGKFNNNCNSKFNGDCNGNDKFNSNSNCDDNGKFNGDGEPGGVEGAAGWGGGV
jgi:hypothetical protein